MNFAFIIGDTSGHYGLHGFHREHFDAKIDDAAAIKKKVFNEEIVSYERVLPKLDFNSNVIFDKIRLFI